MKPKVLIAIPMSYKLDGDVPFFTGRHWLRYVQRQDYRPMDIHVLANDLLPGMLDLLRTDAGPNTVIEHIELGNEPDRRVRRKKHDKVYTRFAEVRNLVLDRVLTTDADYFVSIDSDIIVHPDTVSRLVAQIESKPDYGMIAAAVNNTCRKGMNMKHPKAVFNFGKRDGNGKLKAWKDFKPGKFVDVDYTGACCVMRVSAIRENPTIKWGPRKHGEDSYFCEKMQAAGFKLGVDTSIVTLHLMDRTGYKQRIELFNARILS